MYLSSSRRRQAIHFRFDGTCIGPIGSIMSTMVSIGSPRPTRLSTHPHPHPLSTGVYLVCSQIPKGVYSLLDGSVLEHFPISLQPLLIEKKIEEGRKVQ